MFQKEPVNLERRSGLLREALALVKHQVEELTNS
jgi:hypothetical protein